MNSQEKEIIKLVQNEPTGLYSRKIWFLYEWLIDKKLPLDDLTSGNYVEIIVGNPCGTFGVPYLNLRNKSNDKKIGVTIEVRWMYNNRPRTESRIYNTFPGQVVGLGCPIPGPTSQRFDYILIAAWFI